MSTIVRVVLPAVALMWVVAIAIESFQLAVVVGSVKAIFDGPQDLTQHWQQEWKVVANQQGFPSWFPLATLALVTVGCVTPWHRLRKIRAALKL